MALYYSHFWLYDICRCRYHYYWYAVHGSSL